ncbi:hypothetical protein BCR39DRAFT_531024 [Naematelia encephala]|uniref:Macro domain-containing protein n=1 Tax=Naematelia encephala TaxID=71784 RepID=A0A1Y2B4N2_9TREE|nr:hypothetical protein BCR39DRAFT_531024 [Naematelia encephala]
MFRPLPTHITSRLTHHFRSTIICSTKLRNMSSTSPISAEQIPTLTDLYNQSQIPAASTTSSYSYEASLNSRVSIWRGDITHLKADVIVNAANKSLLGGGGVDGAIHRAAGPQLLRECMTLGGAETGQTKVTMGYDLPSKRVAHTVGPVYSRSNSERSAKLLESCYKTSLEACRENGGGVIGFSSISTGVYGYPVEDATKIALETTRKFLEKDDTVTRVIYVVFSKRTEEIYQELVPAYFPSP